MVGSDDRETGSDDKEDSYVGMELLNEYRLVRILAKGGMSRVYLAEQIGMERFAAVKIVRPVAMVKSQWHERFRREARVASRLNHPNIVTVYNFGELEDGALYLAMEFVEGVRLGTLLRNGAIEPGRAAQIALACAKALLYAHSRKVIHRDFKPDNIMLSELDGEDFVKVLDFGIARLIGETTVTIDGELMGTPRYMSPEQCRGDVATGLSDQYALGLVLYEMLVGTPAMAADSPVGYLYLQQSFTPPLPSHDVPELEPFDQFLARTIAKRPADRFPNMGSVVAALAAICDCVPAGDSRTPLCRRPPGEDSYTLSISSLPLELSDSSVPAGAPHAIVVAPEGDFDPLPTQGWKMLRAWGFRQAGEGRADVWLAGLRGDYDAMLNGPPENRTLYCVEGDLSQVEKAPPNMMVGQQPFEPVAVSIALNWIHRHSGSGLRGLLDRRAMHVSEIISSSRRSTHVERLLEVLREEGIRRSALQALAELCEEMVTNAMFHAPVDSSGRTLYGDADKARGIELAAGHEIALSWTLVSRYILVSVQDPFGSLKREHVIDRLGSHGKGRGSWHNGGGAGMGLRIMARVARHLIFAVTPGSMCEVLALVPRDSKGDVSSSVSFLESPGHQVQRLGRELTLRESTSGDTTFLSLVGEISEASDLSPVFQRAGRIVLDLKRVSRFNSHGIRRWLDALKHRVKGQDVVVQRCSLAVVNQLNMVPSLVEGMTITSLMTPYYCPSCDRELLIELAADEVAKGDAPFQSCPRCGAGMEFDGLVDQYFAFVREPGQNSPS